MKQIAYCVILGCSLTALLYALIQIPTSGPSPLDLFVVLAFQIPTMLITKDMVLGEYVFYGIQILFFSTLCYGMMALVKRLRQTEEQKPK